MLSKKYNKQELLIYGLIWTILFIAPIVAHHVSTTYENGSDIFEWDQVFFVWKQYVLFLVVFLLHNFLLAPLLIEQQRRWLYFSLATVLVGVFVFIQCTNRPEIRKPGEEPRMEDHRPPMNHDEEGMRPHDEFRESDNGTTPFDDFGEPPLPFDDNDEFDDGMKPEHKPFRGPQLEDHPPLIFGQHDLVAIIILILMLGMNLGIKLYFRQRSDRQRLTELEKQNLAQQLEYLKYQINPHFLMNTLNNIHALVDIDAERAKESIVELSKIMRFVLYEGSQPTVPLSRELAFTQDYIRLMRMRVTDRVKISVEMPEAPVNSQLPPMVLITFVENAFKHGVSYRQPSFIDIRVTIDNDQLHFTCRNSKIPQAEDQHGGVGLQNVRQRLDLIYGKNYTLTIDDTPSEYNISLVLPL